MRTLLLLGTGMLLAGTPPTIEQNVSLRSVAAARLSPDGKFVAYDIQKTNWEENAYETEIWIAPVDAAHERFRLTAGKKSSSDPRWSPDSKIIAFLSDRDGKKQIYLIAAAGGEARQVTRFETDIATLRWSPDGRAIAFTAPDPESKERKDRKEKYGEFEVVRAEHIMSHLWVMDAAAEKPEPRRLTEGSYTVGQFSWSPGGQEIAFAAAPNPTPAAADASDIYVVRVDDRKVRKVVSTEGPDGNPVWSPDGRDIAYETANGARWHYYANSLIAVVPAAGGAPRVLTEKFDEDVHLIDWGGGSVWFAAQQKTAAHLFRLNPETGAVERVSGPSGAYFSGFSFSADFRKVAFTGSETGAYAELYAATLRPFRATVLTGMGEQWKGFSPARQEVVEWRSVDGTLVQGVLVKPADFNPAKKYPLLVVIHGGPTGVDVPVTRADRNYPVERLVARGALVLRPNYRGSAGYGARFRALNVRNLGVGDAWDVLSGVDYLVSKGWADPARMGAMGWSQGGYISAFLTTTSARFRAISVGAGISDWTTYYVNTDIPPFTRQYLRATPWQDPEIYAATSPITYVNGACTPTLIQHGENDRRVPIPNAYELYQALEDRGVPVKMIVYKGFGHGINKPKQQRAVLEHNEEWFGRWIWGDHK
jgi:dipeptidyl aminopeptidase/acylaminoacyl peptidase